ncbi:unnamed protein product [Angiostrongylus costaricensis]|uniref:RPOLD domain-containing protein n=1 Tax=Angiostrongylus costaricensis TaxID=334426 RepID=A0A0R3PKJ0_ANGCS|nr:unnamed protein product [Angiostrongylus costaricensis]
MLDECFEYLQEREKQERSFSFEVRSSSFFSFTSSYSSVLIGLVLVVDDGSTDSTADVALEYNRKLGGKLKVLKLEENRGKGVMHSSGKLILFADADGATKFSDVEKLEKGLLRISGGPPMDESFPAVAVGSRAHMEAESIATRSLFRTFLMHAFHILVWLFSSRTVRDTQCGFKLFTRASAAQVCVTWHEVEGSKLVPFWSWLQMGRDLILIWFRYRKYCKRIEVSITFLVFPATVYITADIFTVVVINDLENGMSLDFDLIKVEAPIANALRRVLLAEVPTMAIEKVYLYQNTSVIQVIAVNENGVDCEEEPQPDPSRTVVFNINVTCTKNRNAPSTATEPHQLYHHSSVYSNAFKWVPCGNQEEQFADDPPRMVCDEILVAKLRPGQQIEANCHAVKGIGRDHAKFSPVATASYRLLPTIRLLSEVRGEAAVRLQDSFSEGVIELKEKGDARRDTCSRNVFRHSDLASVVELGKKKDHFIFSVESTGALKSAELVVEACKVMEEKCRCLHAQVAATLNHC